MNAATVGANAATFFIYGVSLILVVWCVIDVTRRSPDELPRGKKTAWVLASRWAGSCSGSSVRQSPLFTSWEPAEG
jgi:hypothetical protein